MSKDYFTFSRLRYHNNVRSREWAGGLPQINDLDFMGVELGGEVGEALNFIKKLSRYNKNMAGGLPLESSKRAIAKELADVIICCDRIAAALDLDLQEEVIKKFNKTSVKNGLKTKIDLESYYE